MDRGQNELSNELTLRLEVHLDFLATDIAGMKFIPLSNIYKFNACGVNITSSRNSLEFSEKGRSIWFCSEVLV